MIAELIIFGMCFISLYLSIFWISLFYVEKEEIHKRERISKFPFVSILVPAHNEESAIAKTLKSMEKIDYPKDKLEVIVINDGSTDRTAEVVKQFKGAILLNKKQGGKGSALNLGIEKARGEIVGVVDADSLVTRNSVKKMIPLLYDENTAAAISGLKVNKPKNLLQKLQRMEYMLAAFIRRLMASINTLYITPGVLSLYKKKVLQEVGGFATDTITEDLEMGVKLKHNGYSIKSQIDAFTYTNVPDTLKKLYNQRLRWRRGFFENMWKYKHMLFNKKYDLMGMFQLPVVILGPVLVFVMAAMLLNEFSSSWGSFMIAIDVLKWKIIDFPEPFTFKSLVLSTKTVNLFTIPIFLSTVFLLSRAQQNLNEKWRHPLAWLVYFTLYIPFLASFWFIAAFYEVFGIKKKW